jgi:hypothetical protein
LEDKELHGESPVSNRWDIRACRFANFCFSLQLALVDTVGELHPLVLGNIKQRSGSGCNFPSFNFATSTSRQVVFHA